MHLTTLPTTPDGVDLTQRFRVTHPYHPLFDQQFDLIIYRHNWKEKRVYFHNAEGRLVSVPVGWTSLVAEDPFVVIAAGRCYFRVADLVALVDLIEGVK
jgi:uncharacterized protein DUF5372